MAAVEVRRVMVQGGSSQTIARTPDYSMYLK